MLPGLSLAVLIILAAARPCLCSAPSKAGLRVDCSSSNLMELPPLPADTTELHLQDNRLTSVSPGLFDRLLRLEKLSLSGNPFHCDCRIQYLRNWLLRNREIVSEQPTCASPSSVAKTRIIDLSDDYFSSGPRESCTEWTFNTVMGGILILILILLLWSLRLAKRASITLYIYERHSGLETNTLHSLKPRHRRRRLAGQSEVSVDSVDVREDRLERPPLNMELLPQVLDVLHKKHNIKINVPEGPLSRLPWNHKNNANIKQS